LEAEAVEAVKLLWKRKHFEEKSWKRKKTRKRLTLFGAGSGIKNYSTASTSLLSYEPLSEPQLESISRWGKIF